MPQLQSGAAVPFDLGAGVGGDDYYTQPDQFAEFGPNYVNAQPMTGAQPMATPKVSTMWYLIGILLIIVAFKFAVEHEGNDSFSFMGISVYNFLAAGSMALLFFILVKIIFNKYYVPGLTDLINVA